MPPHATDILHASCVALDGRGVLILGASGSGKSALALRLMALGAVLVSDDRTEIRLIEGRLEASAPATIRGLIEARGVGLLRAETRASAPLSLAVDLGQVETDRLPPRREITLLGCPLTLLHKVEDTHFTAAILQYLRSGRQA